MPQQSPTQQGGQEGQQISPREVHAYFQQVENQVTQAIQSGNARQLAQWTQANIANSANFQAVIQIGGQNRPGGAAKEIRVLSLNKNDMVRRQLVALSIAPQFLSLIGNYDLGIRVLNVQPVGNDAAVVKTRISESGTIGGNRGQTGRNFAPTTQGPTTQGMGSSEPESEAQDQGPQPGQSGASRLRAQREAQEESQSQAQNQGAQGGRWGGGLQGQGGPIQGSMQGLSFEASAECTQLVQREPNSGRLTIGLSNCTGDVQF